MLIAVALSVCSCDNSENVSNNEAADNNETMGNNETVDNDETMDNDEASDEIENVVDITIGETFTATYDDYELEITLNSVDFQKTICDSSEEVSFEAETGEIYVVARMTIKNVGSNLIGERILCCRNVLLDNKYNYPLVCRNAEDFYDVFVIIEPLKSKEVYLTASVPDELNLKPCEISFKVSLDSYSCYTDDEPTYKYSQE